MNVLYISYWSSGDPLTTSTVLPHLRIAAEFNNVSKIILVTTERHEGAIKTIDLPKVKHESLFASSSGFMLLDRVLDFIKIPLALKSLVKKHNIDLIMAKGVLAGALAHKVSRSLKIPYITESFEPHAEYMRESGEWRKHGFKYRYLKKWESLQVKYAKKIFTVSENYKSFLGENHVPAMIESIPCCVNLSDFAFSVEQRKTTRSSLNIKEEITGIYVGRFGGIYYDSEAFDIFAAAFRFFKNFRLIILSPVDKALIEKELANRGLDPLKIDVLYVEHARVPDYLSAADFAFSTIKPASSRKFCCPVKDGEYWANGLPILLTDGVGDDYKILEQENGGALFNLEKKDLPAAFHKIETILNEPGHRSRIKTIAVRHRSFSLVREVYKQEFID